MSKPESKTELVKRLILAGDKHSAIGIAHTFRLGLSNEQRKAVKAGYEAYHFGDFYRQCGKDPEVLKETAWQTLLTLPFLQEKTV